MHLRSQHRTCAFVQEVFSSKQDTEILREKKTFIGETQFTIRLYCSGWASLPPTMYLSGCTGSTMFKAKVEAVKKVKTNKNFIFSALMKFVYWWKTTKIQLKYHWLILSADKNEVADSLDWTFLSRVNNSW